MKGILGKKLGMTQIFDPETGGVTPVTVIEAGPCPVVTCGPRPRTATTPCSSRTSLSPSGSSAAARSATWRKNGVEPHRHVLEFRGATELVPGETVTVEVFEPGDKVKVAGIGIGKGFAGTIKRHNFHRGPASHGSHNVRAPGSIGASATPSRVFKGMKMAGRMGGKRRTQTGLTVHSIEVERNLLLVKGAIPGPKNGIVEVREQK